MTRTYICASDAGGQGKTTLAQLLYLGLKRSGQNYSFASADFLNENGQSKIGRLFPGVADELGPGPDLIASKRDNNPFAAFRYWDRLGGHLLKGNVVVDLGANVMSQILGWARHRHFVDIARSRPIPPIDIMLICKAELHAIEDVASLLGKLTHDSPIPVDRFFVVLNEVDGPFGTINAVKKIPNVAPQRKINFLTLPRCTSELWPHLEQHFVSIDRALASSDDELLAQFDADIWSITAGRSDLAEWQDSVLDAFQAAGVFGPEAEPQTVPHRRAASAAAE